MCLPLANLRGEQLKESPCSTMAVSFRFLVLHPTMVMVMVYIYISMVFIYINEAISLKAVISAVAKVANKPSFVSTL